MSLTVKNRNLDAPIPHPILDNTSKMMRIIANPVYDKLTISRAANIRNSSKNSLRPNKSKYETSFIPLKSINIEQTISTPLPNSSEPSQSRRTSKSSLKHQIPTRYHLPTPPAQTATVAAAQSTGTNKNSTRNNTSFNNSRSTSQSIQSALADKTSNIKQPVPDGTVRYVNSRHGFEVQRYSSCNWLSTDVFTKDACQEHEKTFREMLDKKHQRERLSRSIYSSEYYSKRWNDLLQSYKQGYLTHTEWAKQNYQLLCLRTLYTKALKREQRDIDLDAEDVRRNRAASAFKEWKETKHEDRSERNHVRLNTGRSRVTTTEGTSTLSNNSFAVPLSTNNNNNTDENNVSFADTSLPLSVSTNGDHESQRILTERTNISSKDMSYVYDEKRWSLKAMLQRIVGLSEPLPPPTQPRTSRLSSLTTIHNLNNGFKSTL